VYHHQKDLVDPSGREASHRFCDRKLSETLLGDASSVDNEGASLKQAGALLCLGKART